MANVSGDGGRKRKGNGWKKQNDGSHFALSLDIFCTCV